MKTLNVLLMIGMFLLFTCGTVLAFPNTIADTSSPPSSDAKGTDSESGRDTTAPVPEPATMVLLGSGLAALAIGARKRKK